MAANHVKCPCGAILRVPDGPATATFGCSKCGRRLKRKPVASPPSPAARPSSSPKPKANLGRIAWMSAALLGAAVVGGGLVFWLTPRGEKALLASRKDRDDEIKVPVPAKSDVPSGKTMLPGDGIDWPYVCTDFGAAVLLHPARLLKSPLAKSLPAAMLEEMARETGVDPRKVERAMILIEPIPASKGTAPQADPPTPGWKEYPSPEGRFAARFPSAPKMESKKGPDGVTGGGAAELPEGIRFEVQFTDFDPAVAAVPKIMLDAITKQFAAETRAQKDVKIGGHTGTELMVEKGDLAMAMRIFMVKERMYHLLVTSPKAKHDPSQAAQFLDSFRLLDGAAPKESPLPAKQPGPDADNDLPFLPAVILRFTEAMDGKGILAKNLGFLQSKDFKGTKYFQSQTKKQGSWPLAGCVVDDHTLLIAPEPTLLKMLAVAGGDSPLLAQLRRIDPKADAAFVLHAAPFRSLAAALPLGQLLPDLDGKKLAEGIKATTATVRLEGDPLLTIEIEGENAEGASALHKAAATGVEMLRKIYPPLRESFAAPLPPDLAGSAVKIADQIFEGFTLELEGTTVRLALKRPVNLDEQPNVNLIASSGFNDALGMNRNPVPDSPFPLGTKGKSGGAGEPGWAGAWRPAHAAIAFQKSVVFEGDGAAHVTGVDNVGPGFSRKLAEPQRGVFQVEQYVQAPAGGVVTVYLNNGDQPFHTGPVWGVQGGRFQVVEAGVPPDTGVACPPGAWHKVTVQVDVPRKQWSLLIDDKRIKQRQPLKFRNVNEPQLDTIAYLCRTGPGIYLDAVRVTRLPDDALVKAFAPKPTAPLPPGHIASTGFNHARGLHSDPEEGPFPLDTPNRAGGEGEPGWAGPWPAHADAMFQSKVVHEGDGALHLKGRPNFGPNYRRRLAEPQTGTFELEYRIQVPAGSSCGAYLWRGADGGAYQSGPNWSVRAGRFMVSDGDEKGSLQLVDAFPCQPGQWHKVKLRVDVAKRQWEFFVDDQPFKTARPLGFRSKVEYLDVVNFLVEGGVYIDELRFTRPPAE